MASESPIIIVGSGLAGYNVAREFRKLNKEKELIIIADDAADFYSKPMLSNALDKKKTAADLAMFDAEKMAGDLNAKILKHTRVEKIDPSKQTVQTHGNDLFHYSHLVLATGSSCISIPFEGNATDKILSVNDLADYAAFRKAIEGKKSVAIIGAGLIGCEFANDLVLADYDASVIDLSELPLARLLPEQAGQYVKQALSKQGVKWCLGQKTKSIQYNNEMFTIEFDDGSTITADVVLSAVGLIPNTQLCQDANIAVNQGIVVNQQLMTSDKNIFALGDCAEVEGLFLPYVMPLMNCARAIAKSLNGELTSVSYPAMPVMVKTPSCPVVVVRPRRDAKGEWAVVESDDGVQATFTDEAGKLKGYALVGKAVEEKQRLTKELPLLLP